MCPVYYISHANGGPSDGVMTNATQSIFVKPCKRAEIDFYESAKEHPELRYFIPEQLGALSLTAEKDPIKAAAKLAHSRNQSRQLGDLERVTSASSRPESPWTSSGATKPEAAWIPSGGGKIDTNDAIVLENVACGFKKPNVLDIKLGARLWADDAPIAKRERLDKASAETTSKDLGFRIAGMRTWRGDDGDCKDKLTQDGYKVYDKVYGRSLTKATIRNSFEEYFQLNPGEKAAQGLLIRRVINRMVSELADLQHVLEQEESRMYSSSLLFIYEGDLEALKAGFKSEKASREALEREMDQAQEVNGVSAEDDQPHEVNGVSADDDQPQELNGISADDDLSTSQVLTGIEPNVLLAIHAANPSTNTPNMTEHAATSNGDAANQITPLVLNVADIDTDDDQAEEDPIQPAKTTVLKLIDFAHAQWTPGQGPDENVLHGIRNVAEVLETFL